MSPCSSVCPDAIDILFSGSEVSDTTDGEVKPASRSLPLSFGGPGTDSAVQAGRAIGILRALTSRGHKPQQHMTAISADSQTQTPRPLKLLSLYILDIPFQPASDPANFCMSTLLHAAAILFGRDPQWVDRPVLSTSTSTLAADFSIATAPNQPPDMAGAVYDAFPVASATSTLAAALATGAAEASSMAASAATSGSPKDDGRGECRLLGSFALFVQLALGGLALMSLVYKRWRERPQRPLKIWFFDASKQVFGSVLVHMANVFMSMLTSGRFSVTVEPAAISTAAALVKRLASSEGPSDEYTPNPCSFYLLNLAIDVSRSSSSLLPSPAPPAPRPPFAYLFMPIKVLFCELIRGFADLLSRPRSAYQS